MRNTWLEINLDNIKYNLQRARELIGPKIKIAAVLKANAYGHGSVYTAKALIEEGIDMLAVACLSEAIELRREYTNIPILIMGFTEDEHLRIAAQKNITLTIFSLEQAKLLSDIGKEINKNIKIHIKVNTGMNRIGFRANKETINTIEEIHSFGNIIIEGIFSHLALKNADTDREQFEIFMEIVKKLESRGIFIELKHICDGIGMVYYPDYRLDMVRIGSFIYGGQTLKKEAEPLRLAMTFKTKISQVKEIEKGEGVGYDYDFVAPDKCIVGTLPVGYADGYMRCLTGKGEVIVRGKRASVIGKICMDQLMIDLTNIPEAKPGDEAILLGGYPGPSIPLAELAEKANTNKNEILSIISRRVPRIYTEDHKNVAQVDYLLD
ncbi:MAG: alanine racemase [Tissierellaceae bacterium]|nr:alanine racemase [Tissierellaceae bacterium]